MDKMQRVRIMLGQVKSLLNLPVTGELAPPLAGTISPVKVESYWSGAITWGPAQSGTAGSVPLEEWHMLHIHADGELKLAIRFHDFNIHVIVFKPGPWERWFTTFQLGDDEVISPD